MRVKTELNVSRTAFRVTIQSNLFLHFFINLKQLRRSSGMGFQPGLYRSVYAQTIMMYTLLWSLTHTKMHTLKPTVKGRIRTLNILKWK